MSFIVDTFFGGAEKKAAKQQADALRQGQEFIREATRQARGDVIPLTDLARNDLTTGFTQAANLLAGSAQPIVNAFSGGNLTAQETVANSLPAIQAAILGGNIDLSPFRPRLQSTDTTFLTDFAGQLQQQFDENMRQQQENDLQNSVAAFLTGQTRSEIDRRRALGRTLGDSGSFFDRIANDINRARMMRF